MWPGYWSHEFGIEQPNARLQPRRHQMLARAAVGCKPRLGRQCPDGNTRRRLENQDLH